MSLHVKKGTESSIITWFLVCAIGMEVASYLADKAASVSIVDSTTVPFERSLGPQIGKMTMEVGNTDP